MKLGIVLAALLQTVNLLQCLHQKQSLVLSVVDLKYEQECFEVVF